LKAIVCTKYGSPDVLEIREIKKPVPRDNEILVRNYATSVTAADYRIRGLNVPLILKFPMRLALGFRKPRKDILGMNFAGKIEAVGKSVEQYKIGDAVFGTLGDDCGAYAEYLCVPEEGALATKPANMTYEEAAVFPFGAFTALSFLRDMAGIQSGEKVLVYGASGAVGTAAVQLAKYFDAEVTAVCSTDNLEWVKTLGADRLVDYTREDFTRNGEKYDIIFDTVTKAPLSGSIRSLEKNGRYLFTYPEISYLLRGLWISKTSDKKVINGLAGEKKEDLEFLKKLIEAGKIRSVIDRSYSFERIVEAHRYADQGHKKGNVVITFE
jgi:NADPH:quinone reductase-like Zn-dependent oxidoreductase